VIIPESESPLWHNLADNEDLYQLTLPEGWILEVDGLVTPLGSFPLDVPIQSQTVLRAWLPDGGPEAVG
jgi:hypothetical protein